MTKRILSCLLVLAMLVSGVPAPFVSAEGAQNAHTHSDAHACGTQCGGNVVWEAWTNTGALPTESGHYYLTDDVQLTTTNDVAAGKDITICLNGYDLKSASDKRIGFVYGKLTIADCTAYTQEGQYISGSVVGGTTADGAVLSVRRGGTLVLEDGIITGGFPPCGVCRQVMREFCEDDFMIYMVDADGYEARTLAEILPFSFSAKKHMN